MISVYSDGSSMGRVNRPGGYGFVIVKRDEILAWSYGGSVATTNNKMELEGAIQGLRTLLVIGCTGDAVELVSDSQYVLGIATGAYHASGNLEQVEALRQIVQQFRHFSCRWVRGHQGDHWNEICDKLARQGKLENTPPEDIKPKPVKRKARRERRLRAREARAAASNVPTGSGPD